MSHFRGFFFMLMMLSAVLDVQADHEYFFSRHPEKTSDAEFKVEEVYTAKNGLVWLGTDKGFYYYDGREFTNLPASDTTELKLITAICEDNRHTLWIGTDNGELYYLEDDRLIKSVVFPDTLNTGISSLVATDDGYLWVGTRGEGLFLLRDDKVDQLTVPQIADNYINDIFLKGEQLWVGTDRGLTIISGKGESLKTKFLSSRDGLPDNIVLAISSSRTSDLIWFGFQSGAFCAYDTGTDSLYIPQAADNWRYGAVKEVLVYEDDLLWLGTNGTGVIEWNRKDDPLLHQLYYDDKLSESRIFDLELDSECNAWIATNHVGLLSTNKQVSFVGLEDYERELVNVLTVHADKNGYVWYATTSGLYRYNPYTYSKGVFEQFMKVDEGELIISIFSTKPGVLWLGTFGNGLYYFNTNTGKRFKVTKRDGLINDNILSISGKDNEIWLATLGGVSKCTFENGINSIRDLTFTNFSQQDGLGTNYIYQAFIDSKDRIWFATDGEGITKLEDGNFTNYNKSDGLKSEVIYSISEDKQGSIWFSTPDEGIYKITDSSFVNYNTDDGIRDLNISSIVCDKMGRIVIVHGEGIDILDPRTEHVYSAAENEFLLELQSDLNDHTTDSRGVIWIGAQKGLLRYSALTTNCRTQPTTLLIDIKVMLKKQEFESARVLPFSQNHVSFDYAGLWYQNPDKVEYQHMLEGYDLRWINSKDESVIYPNLNPGTYTFKLRSSIDKNFTDAEVVSFEFRVKPPFYLTPWFIIGMILLITLSIFWYIRAREKRLKALERLEKEKVDFQFQTLRSQVNPHFLFNSFNTLLNIIDIDQGKASDYVERLSDFFRNLLTYREKELISLEEELKILDDYYYLQQKRYGENFSLQINTPSPEQYCVPPMTLQLLVENALKHNVVSKSKPLTVNIFFENDHLVVQNNLQRKIEAERSTRVGLSNIIKRYQLLFEKEVKVEETEEHFIVRLPIIKC